MAWNVVWNSLFERWEARQQQRGRSVWRRIAHALGMEGGLVVMLVPLFAWWFKVSLWQAFLMDLGLLLFFLVYTFAFNWAFDRVFGLPASAQGQALPQSVATGAS
ncbi:Bacterial Transmembrane Pair family protein [compost metagenome]